MPGPDTCGGTWPATMSEAQLSAAVVELAELLGWRVFTVRRSDRAIVASRTGAGFPDLVMVRSGRVLAVELKREGARPTVAQHAWLAALDGCPGVEVAVWRPAQWCDGAIERTLRASRTPEGFP